MDNARFSRRRLMGGAMLLAAIGCGAAPVSAGTPLVIGSVQEDVMQEEKAYGPFVRYLRERLKADGVSDVRLLVHTSIEDMERSIDQGAVDLYIDSPLLTAMVSRRIGSRPFMRVWKEGAAEYGSVIFSRAENGVATLDELRGKVIAFKKSESTPGYILPRAFLADHGLRLVEVSSPQSPVPEDAIGFVFSHGDRTSLAWVMKGIVAASVLKDSDFFDTSFAAVRGQLRLLAQTDPVPRQVLVHRAGLDADVVRRLHDVLSTMDADEAGRSALMAMHETTRLDDFPAGADATLGRLLGILDSAAPGN